MRQQTLKTTPLLMALSIALALAFVARGAPGTSPAAGHLAVVGLNLDGSPKSFAVAALAHIPAGSVIHITDRGWIGQSDGFLANSEVEGTINWTTPAQAIAAGTLIMFELDAAGAVLLTPALGSTTVSGYTAGDPQVVPWNGGGEQLLIFTGSDQAPNFIYGLSNSWINGSPDAYNDWQPPGQTILATGSKLPAQLAAADPPVAVAFNGHAANRGAATHLDNLVYTGVRAGSRDDLLAAIGDQTNWAFDDITPFDLTPDGAQFGPNPVFSVSVPTNIDLAADRSAGPIVDRLLLVALLLAAAALTVRLALRKRA